MILVTGGCGYIGSHFVLACQDAGRSVSVIDNLSTGRRDAIDPRIPFIQGDFANPALIALAVERFGVTAIVHFAAKISVPESMREPALYDRENREKTAQLVALCQRHGIGTFVFSSTAAVYGPPDAAIVSETSATRPISPYGSTKLDAESVIRTASHMRHVILRYFNVAGADPGLRSGQRNTAAGNLMSRLCAVALHQQDVLDIFGTDFDTPDGSAIRDFIHVSDLARAHLAALDYLQAGGQSVTLNCGTEHGVSVLEAVKVMSAIIGHSVPHRIAKRREGDIAKIIADASRLKAVLYWSPKYDLRAMARDSLAFARSITPDARTPLEAALVPKTRNVSDERRVVRR